MSILPTAAYREDLGGQSRILKLGNPEIQRFEKLPGEPGIFDMWKQLMGDMPGLKATQVRDLVALALVGGGCPDRQAEDIVSEMGPDQNMRLRSIAQRVLGLTFWPDLLTTSTEKKSPAVSSGGKRSRRTTAPQPGSGKSPE